MTQVTVFCVAGQGDFRCRSDGFVLQVNGISVAGLRFWAERGRKSASGAF